jgi:hypothetical protein
MGHWKIWVEGILNCTRPPPPKKKEKINSLIYNTYLFVISCIVDQNLLVVANMQAYNSLTKIHYFQANAFLSWRRAENDSCSVCRLPCLQSRYFPYNIYLPISSFIYPLMSATIECIIQVVSWLDCINYTPHLILILIKRTFSKYPALISYSICQFRLRALKLKRV